MQMFFTQVKMIELPILKTCLCDMQHITVFFLQSQRFSKNKSPFVTLAQKIYSRICVDFNLWFEFFSLVPEAIQLAACYTVLDLSPCNPEECYKALNSWFVLREKQFTIPVKLRKYYLELSFQVEKRKKNAVE